MQLYPIIAVFDASRAFPKYTSSSNIPESRSFLFFYLENRQQPERSGFFSEQEAQTSRPAPFPKAG